ncbi:MAG: bifunctional (p)ppGpp synthetase/guanosine-3',5'-bis(diphosphate) 3'-pyrophosphohydrolase [Anaerolineae bacterium]|nr:bifunctional (p)ppGpp synthetase/guanosine-3',5'-bis(diphosphate) 3'-pyrophosphohydrolase [Anaerolineae bacterium]
MTFDEKDLSLIIEATRFAAEKHANQRRRNKEASPYINHPITVAEILWQIGHVRDISVLVAAILHDTIEDTETTPEEIEQLFGPKVLSLVQEVSDDKSKPKMERKRLQIENAPHKSPGAKLIKLGDKISNIHDITDSPPASWSLQRKLDYLDWTEKVIAGVRGTNAALEAHYDQLLNEARAELLAERHQNGHK